MENYNSIEFKEALAAMQWAYEVAERGESNSESPKVSRAELEAMPLTHLRACLDSLLMTRHAEAGLDALHTIGALDVWLPEVSAMVGFGDSEWRHKDVWKHTKQVVWQSVPRLAVRWAALLHDIGKVKTRTVSPTGEVHFFGHSEVGAAMFRKRVSKRLGFEGDLYRRIHFLIYNHLRASQYDGSWTDSAVRRFAREMGDGLTDLLDLSRADITTKRPERRKRGLRQISELASRIRALHEADARQPALPKGLGNVIMAHFSLPPSRRIGDIKRALEDAVERGEISPRQSIEYYVSWIDANRDRYAHLFDKPVSA